MLPAAPGGPIDPRELSAMFSFPGEDVELLFE